MTDLTDNARKNLAAGATDGAGTHTCRKCGGHKEDRRLNSMNCKACESPGPVTHKVTVGLSPDVMAALSVESTAKGRTVADQITLLLNSRHERHKAAAMAARFNERARRSVDEDPDDPTDQDNVEAGDENSGVRRPLTGVKMYSAQIEDDEREAEDLHDQFLRDQ